MVTVKTKEVSGVRVQDVYRRECGYIRNLEKMNEDWIKKELRIDGIY